MPATRMAIQRRACAAAAACAACGGDPPPAPLPPLVITTARSLPTATVGVSYDLIFAATGASGLVRWTLAAGGLPTGITLSELGQLTGTPSIVESRTFTVRATSDTRSASADFTLGVDPVPLVITTTTLTPAVLGASYSQVLQAVGGEGTPVWSLASGALPPGIVLGTSGIVAGNASALGSFDFVARVTRGTQSAQQPLSLTVAPPPLSVATATVPLAKVGRPYTVALQATGGVGGNTWTLTTGRLPAGLTLSASGTIAGSPTLPESTTFTVEVTSGAQRATRPLSLWVDPAGFPSTALVTMPGNVFVPFLVQIQLGGTVTWRFGADEHNAIFVPTPGAPADINIVSNVDVSRRFDTLGTFRYDCTIHPGMSGIIDVKP